ncbi:hypothetical protein N9860_03005 [Akkermansiaceae bacterium]|nr:hypothetical protein [Akkermansiaceae bacterium]MDB4275871.1 hypothetical protein [Akkermansiaceae bacterium]MDB4325519.1 hypothetical protein [Akkermansiaceae bacterium]MDB4687942.1 hypothetical protein [Akkermansiaceae bacterium]MDB4787897.1 hypothetical protein [Akkermansiaceae bacterium]
MDDIKKHKLAWFLVTSYICFKAATTIDNLTGSSVERCAVVVLPAFPVLYYLLVFSEVKDPKELRHPGLFGIAIFIGILAGNAYGLIVGLAYGALLAIKSAILN